MNIVEDHDYIAVEDDGFYYNIYIEEPYRMGYGRNNLYMPFIKDVNSNSVKMYHEEIKRLLLNLDDICDNLPKLELCRLPTHEDFNDNFEILSSNGYIYDDGLIRFYPLSKEYQFSIYYGIYDNFISFRNTGGINNCYCIDNKIVDTNQPFNAELFCESIMTYVEKYLIALLSIFKPNKTKSARLN